MSVTVVRTINKTFMHLKGNHFNKALMEYKMAKAASMEIIIGAKREFQRLFCESKGRETKRTDRWERFYRMSGIRRTCELSVLTKGNREKAELQYQ